CRQAEGGDGTHDAFGHFAVEAGENLREMVAFSQFDSNGTVAGEVSCAGEDKVADAGESCERLATATTGYRETGDFGDTSSDERGGRVVSEIETVDDAGGQGNDIFQC